MGELTFFMLRDVFTFDKIISMKSFPFTHELGWSVSRYDTFYSCKRKYYYGYYGKYDHEFEWSKISTLKSLTSVPLEIGNIAHDVMEMLLKRLVKSSDPIDKERLKTYVRNLSIEYIGKKQFIEVYYNEKNSIDEESIIQTVWQCVMNVVDSERFEWIRQLPQDSKDRWIIEPPGFGETRIEDMKAYCKVDFMLPFGRDIYILDWKTGKEDPEKHRKQLIGYSLFAKYHFENNFEFIHTMVCYIKDGFIEKAPDISKVDVDQFVETVRAESQEMKSFNMDVERNTPKDKSVFEMTSDISKCRFCEYRELCGRK